MLDKILEPIEALFDQVPIVVNPQVEVAERLGAQRVEAPLAVGADPNESPVMENSQVARDPGLADREAGGQRPHRALSLAQFLDNAETRAVRQDLERRCRGRHG